MTKSLCSPDVISNAIDSGQLLCGVFCTLFLSPSKISLIVSTKFAHTRTHTQTSFILFYQMSSRSRKRKRAEGDAKAGQVSPPVVVPITDVERTKIIIDMFSENLSFIPGELVRMIEGYTRRCYPGDVVASLSDKFITSSDLTRVATPILGISGVLIHNNAIHVVMLYGTRSTI